MMETRADQPADHGSMPRAARLDRFLDRFGSVAHVLATLLLYAVTIVALGAALAPALWVVAAAFRLAPATALRWPLLGLASAVAYFVFGFALMAVVALLNFVLPTRVRAFRGTYYTLGAVPWFLHNGLFYLVRFTFLPFATFTPFGVLFLRAMGMTIGRRSIVNTEYLSDLRLLSLGREVVIGGSARIFAHYGGGGHLNIAPVSIGDRVTIGVGATVMGGAVLGADSTLLPHSVLLPGGRMGAGETWGGVPARCIAPEAMAELKSEIRRPRRGATVETFSG